MVRSVRFVKDAWLNSGLGLLDFVPELEELRPDIFIVNEDGHTLEKAAQCVRLGIEYRVLQRRPEPGLPERSSSELRSRGASLPYRAEICGGWLDQPFINSKCPGYVICAQLTPNPAFTQGGLATSTRATLAQLMAAGLYRMEPETLARTVFRIENGIDQPHRPISGAQDALGLCLPGISFQYYDNGYWPRQVESISDPATLRWLEAHLSLYPLRPRAPGFDPLRGCNLRDSALESLTQASALCKNAIEQRGSDELSESISTCRQAQNVLFPAMFPPQILSEMARLEARGHFQNWKFTGCGGGGWALLMNAVDLPSAIPLKIAFDRLTLY